MKIRLGLLLALGIGIRQLNYYCIQDFMVAAVKNRWRFACCCWPIAVQVAFDVSRFTTSQ